MRQIKDNELDRMLKSEYDAIEPVDSWEDLRNRISKRLDGSMVSNLRKKVTIWRYLSISMAASLLLVSGLLIYSVTSDLRINPEKHTGISQKDIEKLTLAFSQVRQLFNEGKPWFVLGPDQDTTIGVNGSDGSSLVSNKFVVMRLIVRTANDTTERHYDIVAYPNKIVTFKSTLGKESIFITLKPTLINGNIEVEFETKINGGSEAKTIASLNQGNYTPLVGIETHRGWINIQGVAQIVSEI